MNLLHSQTQRLLRKVNCPAVSLLIVEDNDASRRLVIELLRAAGFVNLSFARNAEEALDHLQNQAPDLMLLDWNLPGMSGLELVTLIRAAAHRPDVRIPDPALPVVMLTARQRANDVALARDAGISEFVVKPFSTSSLLKAISSALTRKRPASTASASPERRRRKAQLFPGLLRRPEDGAKHTSVEAGLQTLRSFMGARGQAPEIENINQVIRHLMAEQAQAHAFHRHLVEQATQSLNDYVTLAGKSVDSEVIDVHIDALIRLNEAPYTDPDEALNIIRHLKVLVTKRKTSRRLASRIIQ